MSKVMETSLVLKKETKFDKIRIGLLKLFFNKKDFEMFQRIENLITPKRNQFDKIIVPKEKGNGDVLFFPLQKLD